MHDPARYFQPDVVADFSGVAVTAAGPDRVRVEGGDGTQRTGTLKVSVGYVDSYIGEGQIPTPVRVRWPAVSWRWKL